MSWIGVDEAANARVSGAVQDLKQKERRRSVEEDATMWHNALSYFTATEKLYCRRIRARGIHPLLSHGVRGDREVGHRADMIVHLVGRGTNQFACNVTADLADLPPRCSFRGLLILLSSKALIVSSFGKYR